MFWTTYLVTLTGNLTCINSSLSSLNIMSSYWSADGSIVPSFSKHSIVIICSYSELNLFSRSSMSKAFALISFAMYLIVSLQSDTCSKYLSLSPSSSRQSLCSVDFEPKSKMHLRVFFLTILETSSRIYSFWAYVWGVLRMRLYLCSWSSSTILFRWRYIS